MLSKRVKEELKSLREDTLLFIASLELVAKESHVEEVNTIKNWLLEMDH